MPSILIPWRPLTRPRCVLAFATLAFAALAAFPRPAAAQIGSARYASIVIDAASGAVLSAANPDEYRYPASLTKMMTLYMLFEAVRDRRISFDQLVPVSPSAASMPPTKLGLVPGSRITVEQAVFGLVTRSANDAAAALGELMGGDEERFAEMMTLRAHALGMTHTRFGNASGLPDWNQVTTARDMAILARHLIQDFPGDYHYFSTPEFHYGRQIIRTHQHLLQTYPGADGLKTGYTDASGYNVVTSAVRGNVRLIGVVMGASSGGERDQHMTVLLDEGFDKMGVAPMIARREPRRGLPSLVSLAQAAPIGPRWVAPRLVSTRIAPAALHARLAHTRYQRGPLLVPPLQHEVPFAGSHTPTHGPRRSARGQRRAGRYAGQAESPRVVLHAPAARLRRTADMVRVAPTNERRATPTDERRVAPTSHGMRVVHPRYASRYPG